MYFPEHNVNNEFERPEPSAPESTPVKKKRTGVKTVALVLCCVLAGGLAGAGGAYGAGMLLDRQNESGGGSTVIHQSQTPATVVTMVEQSAGQVLTPAQLYAANVDACVGITVSTTTNVFGYNTTSAATGSGFVISTDGYIITNYHVIEEAAQNSSVPIEVSFQNGDSYKAKLVGGEEDNDIAVLKIQAEGLKPVALGDSDALVVGESVYAIGNPLGELTFSLTDGLVSARDRVISFGSGDDSVSLNMLQTNCAINSGNSGGPLFNRYGQVIGITTAKMSGTSGSSATIEGLGFAIPINDVVDLVQDIIEHGYVTGKPYMGITVSSVTKADADRYNLPVGAYVETVEAGSCSEKAGLKPGDIITQIDDTVITTNSALIAAKATYKAGDTVTLKITRSGQELELKLTFDEEQQQTQQAQQPQQSQPSQQPQQQPQQQQPQQQWPGNGQDSWNNNDSFFFQWPFGSFFPF
ncbi:MAG: trypsin-like peptidase domain-containing protein [Oscillospiraceae bacterium]|nr:trypsin-like peptidase domain-containing protein [Oscillospiraceae bacterium]